MPSISKTQRWLDLVAFLVARRFPVPVEQIMEGVPAYAEQWVEGGTTDRDSARRKFERDKDELRALGIPLETVRYSINYGAELTDGYRLASRDFYLPYVRLLAEAGDEEEAPPARSPAATAFEVPEGELLDAVRALREVASVPGSPLAREAAGALRKLTFDLEPGRMGDGAVVVAPAPGATEVRERLRLLSDALLRRKLVRFTYYAIGRDERSSREAAPYGLLYQHSRWYLVAHDRSRDDVRVFRVDRMEDVEANRKRANSTDYDIPDGFDLTTYGGRQPWELGDDREPTTEVRVRFAFPRSLWAERNGLGRLEREEDGGDAVRVFDVREEGPFVRWLLSLAGEAEPLEPPEVRDAYRAAAHEVAALYRGGAGG